MFVLLIIIILGIFVALFAMQNPQTVALNFLQYHFVNIPVYVVIAGSLFFGIFISWIISLFNSFFTTLKLHGKDNKIKNAEKDKVELVKQVHKLELENEHFKESDTIDNKSL